MNGFWSKSKKQKVLLTFREIDLNNLGFILIIVKWNQMTEKSYRPRLSTTDIVILMQLIQEKRQILRYKYEGAAPEQQWMVQFWKAEHKRLLPLLRKFERIDPLNYGYNERWKHKRIPKELARMRLAQGIAEMRLTKS